MQTHCTGCKAIGGREKARESRVCVEIEAYKVGRIGQRAIGRRMHRDGANQLQKTNLTNFNQLAVIIAVARGDEAGFCPDDSLYLFTSKRST